MATIVLGLGCSHTPQLSSPIEMWPAYGARDRANPNLFRAGDGYCGYDELAASGDPLDPAQLSEPVWRSKHDRAQRAVAELASSLGAANPDVVVVLGDDQEELFLDDGIPTFAVFWGDHVDELPPSAEQRERIPPDVQSGLWAFHGEAPERYESAPGLGRRIIEQLNADGFDVTALRRQPEGRTLGHAFTFVRRRLMNGAARPMVPVAVNTYYPPNQPDPRRCLGFGRSLGAAIDSWDSDATVAVVASGGLSHFVVDEALDRRVLDAIAAHDAEALTAIPAAHLQSGTSEILNWITAAGALEHFELEVVDYVPAYRTAAGTGVGMAFARWTAARGT